MKRQKQSNTNEDFVTGNFQIWKDAWDNHKKEKLFGSNIELIGRNKELSRFRSYLDSSEIRVIVLSGQHNIGKSRLVLEATANYPSRALIVLDRQSISISDLLKLQSSGKEYIIILEEPNPIKIEDFVRQIITCVNLKLILTISTKEDAPLNNFGFDERIKAIELQALPDYASEEILKAANKNLDFALKAWIIEQASGNPGILLLALSLGEKLRQPEIIKNFLKNISHTFFKKIKNKFGEKAINTLRLLSLYSRFNYKAISEEFEAICKIFNGNLNEIINALPYLEQAGFIKTVGEYKEVFPVLLANYFASSTLHGQFDNLKKLDSTLEWSKRVNLLKRLSYIKTEEVLSFWVESIDNLLTDLLSILKNLEFIGLAAKVIPVKVGSSLINILKNIPLQERQIISDSHRIKLINIIEEMIFKKESSSLALKCLAHIAESELSVDKSSATEVFRKYFHALHMQMPLSLKERLDLVKNNLSSSSRELQLISIKAIKSALSNSNGYSLKYITFTAEPMDIRPTMTWRDIWNYNEELLGLLIEQTSKQDLVVAMAAQKTLPHVLTNCAISIKSGGSRLISPKFLIDNFTIVIDRVVSNEMMVPVSDLAESLLWAKKILLEWKDVPDLEEKAYSEIDSHLQHINELINKLDKGSFFIRLKRWAGKQHIIAPNYTQIRNEIINLVQDIIADNNLLTNNLLNWLCSDEAGNARQFFWYLGQFDIEKQWLEKIDLLATSESGIIAFSNYFVGLGKREPHFVSKYLDKLIDEGQIADEAILRATINGVGDLLGVMRIEKLLVEKRITSASVLDNLRRSSWLEQLSSKEFLRLLNAIAGEDLNNTDGIIELVAWPNDIPLDESLIEFLWECLEHSPHLSMAFDILAASLVIINIERGFKLLEQILIHHTIPADTYHENNRFWKTLLVANRKRAINLVLNNVLDESINDSGWKLDLSELFDLNKDAKLLLEYAIASEQQALLLCRTIDLDSFLIIKIFECYFSSNEVKDALVDNIIWPLSGVISGAFDANYFESRRKRVEKMLTEPTTPIVARTWLEDLEGHLRETVKANQNQAK